MLPNQRNPTKGDLAKQAPCPGTWWSGFCQIPSLLRWPLRWIHVWYIFTYVYIWIVWEIKFSAFSHVDKCQLRWLVRNIHINETWVKFLWTDGCYKVLAPGATGTTGDEKVLYLKCRIKLDANVGCINFWVSLWKQNLTLVDLVESWFMSLTSGNVKPPLKPPNGGGEHHRLKLADCTTLVCLIQCEELLSCPWHQSSLQLFMAILGVLHFLNKQNGWEFGEVEIPWQSKVWPCWVSLISGKVLFAKKSNVFMQWNNIDGWKFYLFTRGHT